LFVVLIAISINNLQKHGFDRFDISLEKGAPI